MSDRIVFVLEPDCGADALLRRFRDFKINAAFKKPDDGENKSPLQVLALTKGLPGLEVLDVTKDKALATAEFARQKIIDKAKPNGPALAVRASYRDPTVGQQRSGWLIGAKFGSGFRNDSGAGI